MRRVSGLFHDIDIGKTLGHLSKGVRRERLFHELSRWYSLYLDVILDSGGFRRHTLVITDFRQTGNDAGRPVFSFFCRSADEEPEELPGQPLDFSALAGGDTELLIPDCLCEAVVPEFLAAAVLLRLGNAFPELPELYVNRRLFASVRGKSPRELRGMEAVEKKLENRLSYHTDKRFAVDEIREYREQTGRVYRWGDILNRPELTLFDEPGEAEDNSFRRFLSSLESGCGCPSLVYDCLKRLDPDNPPDRERCGKRVRELHREQGRVPIGTYEAVTEAHLRIIAERGPGYSLLPRLYVQDRLGVKTELSERKLPELMAMDIRVRDSFICDKDLILAAAVFYLEYPRRARRFLGQEHISREVMSDDGEDIFGG